MWGINIRIETLPTFNKFSFFLRWALISLVFLIGLYLKSSINYNVLFQKTLNSRLLYNKEKERRDLL